MLKCSKFILNLFHKEARTPLHGARGWLLDEEGKKKHSSLLGFYAKQSHEDQTSFENQRPFPRIFFLNIHLKSWYNYFIAPPEGNKVLCSTRTFYENCYLPRVRLPRLLQTQPPPIKREWQNLVALPSMRPHARRLFWPPQRL